MIVYNIYNDTIFVEIHIHIIIDQNVTSVSNYQIISIYVITLWKIMGMNYIILKVKGIAVSRLYDRNVECMNAVWS
jgi:hypothetical protein